MTEHHRLVPPRLRAALAAAAQGWPVFPLWPGSKRPAIVGWPRHASTDPDILTVWWDRRPYNIGITCGGAGLLVVDLDRPHQTGPDGRLLAALGIDRPTYTVATPHGEHRYYTVQPEDPGASTAGRLGAGIDTRAVGGYVVAAGSVRRLGGRLERYRVVSGPGVAPLPAPRPLLDALRRVPGGLLGPVTLGGSGMDRRVVGDWGAYGRAVIAGEVARVVQARPGTRNASLFTAALRLGRAATAGVLDEAEIAALLRTACEAHLDVDGFTEREAGRTIANGLRYGRRGRPGRGEAGVADGS